MQFDSLTNNDCSLSKKKYTSEDVAAMAGVSQSSVSRVFGGGANVSEKKKKKILEAAEKLNYQPNALASSLSTRKTRIIGIVVRNIRDPFYSAVLEIFHTRMSPLGYNLIFISSENEEIQEKEIIQLLEYNVEGVIVTDAVLSPSAAQKFERNGVEVVLFNRYASKSRSSAVFCDNYLAAKQIATYLVEQGHRSFAFIAGTSNNSTTIDRLSGFEEVLKSRKITDLVVQQGNYTYEGGFKATQELLMKHKGLDCIFCVNDITALGAMDAIRTIGMRIPEDISVFGFDNIRMAAWPTYALTTWEQPLEEMVTTAVEIMIQKISTPNQTRKILMMKGQMIIRNSVRSRK